MYKEIFTQVVNNVNNVNGNISGIKKHILERLKGLYAEQVPKDILITEELLIVMSEITETLNREISISINRKGNVVDVSVGSSGTVSINHITERRKENTLSGIRCIHTHPSGNAELSDVDISALQLLFLDTMVSCGVEEGKPGSLYYAYINEWDEHGPSNIHIEGPLKPEEVYRNNIMSTILTEGQNDEGQMFEINEEVNEKAVLVGLYNPRNDEEIFLETMNELSLLADTAGVNVIQKVIQPREKPDPKYYIGKGKAQELGLIRQKLQVDVVIFNHELSPVQQKNLEDIIGSKVIDRTELILDIFAQRARTKEGKLQVELAQLNYLLPRLIGHGISLSRLGGGIGTRGPGETKLEIDRRRIRKRISDLQKEIEKVKKVRNLQRGSRQAVPLPLISLVGYTNAGKSTLLNNLTKADVLAEDKLFATLDPVTRKLELPSNRTVLLTDTVGFISDIPHHLVAAFRATLEEVLEADLLVHVIDASHPLREEQIKAVNYVLASMEASQKRVIYALNKCDLLPENEIESLRKRYPNSCAISAKTGYGLNELFNMVEELLPVATIKIQVKIPYKEGKLLGAIHNLAEVIKEEFLEDGIYLEAEIDEINLSRISDQLNDFKEEKH